MGNPLVAFALVAEEYESSGDPIRGLRPLFAPLLHDRMGKPFDAVEFSLRFKSTYGLEMTPFIANALKEVLCQTGLLSEPKVGSFEVVNFDWSPDSIDEAQIDQTIDLFRRWAKEKLRLTARTFEDNHLEEAILSRLARPEFSSIFLDKDPGKKTKKLKGLLGLGAIDSSAKDEMYLDYLVADFILAANESAPEVFESISKIAYGSLIADAVAGLATPAARPQKKQPLRVVLDSPILMDLLDLNTPEHKSYAEGLVEVMAASEIMLAVFDHSVDEMRGSIVSTLQAYAKGDAYGPLAERFRTTPGHRLYAVTVMDSLEARINGLGIAILRSKVYEEARFKKYFPEDRVDQVRNSIGDLHEHVEARIRDSLSVATVARLKGEQRLANSLFEAGTVFVTRNSLLARRVNKVLSVGRSGPDPRFTIVTDGQIAGVLWFVSGVAGGESLSRRRLIANCSSAVLPKKEIISRIAGVLEGLSPELRAEFETLMTDRRASLCPMRLTAGIADAVNEDMALRVLGAMKEELVAPVIERATAAEEMLGRREEELQRAHEERKDVVSAMQEVIAATEGKLETEKFTFNEQLAQLRFNLESQDLAISQTRSAEQGRLAELERKILLARSALEKKQRLAKAIVSAVASVLVAVPSLAAIICPDYRNLLFEVVLVLAYVASIKFASAWLERFSSWLVSFMFSADKSFILGLEQAR